MMYAWGGLTQIGYTSDLFLHFHDRRRRFGLIAVILVNKEAAMVPLSLFI